MLAQLPQTYFAKQIADFKSGTRSNPVMSPIANALSAQDIESAARYYASLARPTPSHPRRIPLSLRAAKTWRSMVLGTVNSALSQMPCCWGSWRVASIPAIAGNMHLIRSTNYWLENRTRPTIRKN